MNRQYVVWVDANGRTRLTIVDSFVGAPAVVSDLQALSNADVLNSTDSTLVVNAAPAPVAATYQGVGDSAALVFADAAGNLTTLQLPAPKSAVFLADGETVDAVAIATLVTDATGTLITPAGGAVTTYVGGFRRKTQREDY